MVWPGSPAMGACLVHGAAGRSQKVKGVWTLATALRRESVSHILPGPPAWSPSAPLHDSTGAPPYMLTACSPLSAHLRRRIQSPPTGWQQWRAVYHIGRNVYGFCESYQRTGGSRSGGGRQ